jgi:type II secretory pathway pseudopilin PulG
MDIKGKYPVSALSGGFTLIEMIMIIVVMGILLPGVIMPFLNASKGVATPIKALSVGSAARSAMDAELVRVNTVVWPTGISACQVATYYCTGTTLAQPAAVVLNGVTYTSTIKETFCDTSIRNGFVLNSTTCVNTGVQVPGSISHYLVVQVGTSGSDGSGANLETIMTYDF